MKQDDDMPFSDQELVAAFVQVMPEPDALRLVSELRKPFPDPEKRNVRGTRLTDDTLDLLVTVSEELAARVEAYRNGPWFRSEL